MIATKYKKYTTPRSVASYPFFNNPDEYKGATRYKADLIADREEAAPFMEKCEKVLRDFVEAHNKAVANEEKKGKKINLKKALLNLPFEDHETDDSKVVIHVRQNAQVNNKLHRIFFYDSAQKQLDAPPLIYHGSVVKIAGLIRPHDGLGGGVNLSISAVQIIELSKSSSGVVPEYFGFSEELGYIDEEQ